MGIWGSEQQSLSEIIEIGLEQEEQVQLALRNKCRVLINGKTASEREMTVVAKGVAICANCLSLIKRTPGLNVPAEREIAIDGLKTTMREALELLSPEKVLNKKLKLLAEKRDQAIAVVNEWHKEAEQSLRNCLEKSKEAKALYSFILARCMIVQAFKSESEILVSARERFRKAVGDEDEENNAFYLIMLKKAKQEILELAGRREKF